MELRKFVFTVAAVFIGMVLSKNTTYELFIPTVAQLYFFLVCITVFVVYLFMLVVRIRNDIQDDKFSKGELSEQVWRLEQRIGKKKK